MRRVFQGVRGEDQTATQIDTVIVGGGQAALSVSYHLTRLRVPHLVLERATQVAEAWRNHRWDSFTPNTPNWQSCLPGRSSPPPKQAEFHGKVALITGGTSGIGAATARLLTRLGARVVITGRRRREGRSLLLEIVRNGGCAAFIQADLSRPEEVRRIVPFVIKTYGRLDYAFNNAGTSGDNGLPVGTD